MKSQRSLEKSREHNWTAESAEAFAHRIAFDFIAQIERYLHATGIERNVLADRLGVSAGAVSQVLNNPQNLKLSTIGRYCQALGLKASVVAYDDGDHDNKLGLINSQVFVACWEKLDRPRDSWAIRELDTLYAGNSVTIYVQLYITTHNITTHNAAFCAPYPCTIVNGISENTVTQSLGSVSLPSTSEAL